MNASSLSPTKNHPQSARWLTKASANPIPTSRNIRAVKDRITLEYLITFRSSIALCL